MKLLPLAVLFVTAWATGGRTYSSPLPPPDSEPRLLVQDLYRQVVTRGPVGIPRGSDWIAFAPFLGQDLLKKINDANACAADRDHHVPDPKLEQQIAGRFRLFSGDASRTSSFKIGNTELQKDGPFRVYVTLTTANRWRHRVAAIVIRENGRFVLDDVIYLDDNTWEHEEDRRNKWLSHYLAAGCHGSKWVGAFLPKEPTALAQSLYANVVAHPTSGIPFGEEWKLFEPYLSQSILHRMAIYNACVTDEERYYAKLKGPPMKLATLDENGIFSGGDEEEAPRTVKVEKTEPQRDGTVRVTVRLGLPQYDMEWLVIDVFRREHDRFVLQDVIFPDEIFLKGVRRDGSRGPDGYLSRVLVQICHGGTHFSGRF